MKCPFHCILLLAATSALLAAPPDLNNHARNFIPDSLEVSAFIPPTPVARKPLPSIRINATATLPSKSRTTLTLQRGEASILPDIPPPPPPDPANPARELTAEDRTRIAYQRKHSLYLGATVYDHKVSQVQWTDQETGEIYQAICGFDIGLLAGIGSFVRDGKTYSVFLMHSNFDSVGISDTLSDDLPCIPEIAQGQILVTRGDTKNPDAIAPLHYIRDLIAAEKARLLAYQSARIQQQDEAAAWAKAHPPVARNETVIFRPHRGSRYLANPQPAKKGEATR